MVRLRQRLNQKTYYQIESCGKAGWNERIIDFLKGILYDDEIENCSTAADLISKNLVFDTTVKQDQAVEVLFREVKDILTRLPVGMERKPKQIAKDIINLLLEYIWIREKYLFMRPQLSSANREELKKHILRGIPPPYMLERAKAVLEMEKKYKKNSGKNTNRICDQPQPSRPSDDVLNSNWEAYIAKKEERDRKELKVVEAERKSILNESVYDGSHTMQEDMEFEEENFFSGFQIMRVEHVDYDEESKVTGDIDVAVSIEKADKMYVALLDSGAFRSGTNDKLRKYCERVLKLIKPLRIKAEVGVIYDVRKIGSMKKVIIIGNDIWKQYNSNPLSSPKKAMTREENKVSQITEGGGCSYLAIWFEEMVGAEKIFFEEVEKVVYENSGKEAVNEYAKVGKLPEASQEKEPSRKLMLATSEYIPNKDIGEEAVKTIYLRRNDVELKGIDERLNLDHSAEEVMENMKKSISQDFGRMNLSLLNNSPMYKGKFEKLFMKNCAAFVSRESPTQLSILPPIEYTLLLGRVLVVLKPGPLGHEQERFLVKRIT
eukprot:augustus_masked-scaffold_46-processed-gene-1.118-mRNA-1 protein AED:1.00 eAED:1.00 QI:0/0/0/0/1/1/5/0/546